jgi:hypothetical protein
VGEIEVRSLGKIEDQRAITVDRVTAKSNPMRDTGKSEDNGTKTVERVTDKSNSRCEIYAVYRIIEQYQISGINIRRKSADQ